MTPPRSCSCAAFGLLPLLVTAAILVLAQRYVRPVIVAFTGRLLLSTMGLFLVIVNFLVIWVASIVAPDIAIVAQPAALWLLVFAALYTLLSTVMDALLGLNRPRRWSRAARTACGASSSRCPPRGAT